MKRSITGGTSIRRDRLGRTAEGQTPSEAHMRPTSRQPLEGRLHGWRRVAGRPAWLAAVLAMLLVTPAWAHHSASMLDQTKEEVVTGTIKEIQWTNPHIWIQLVAADKSGKQVEWSIEGASPRVMKRLGVERTTMNVGDKVAITINPLRVGGLGGGFVRVKLPTGEIKGVPVGGRLSTQAPPPDEEPRRSKE